MTNAKTLRTFAMVLGLLAGAAAAQARDPWEFGTFNVGDDTSATKNALSHGLVQEHDLNELGEENDQDWMAVATMAGHSYEARLSGTNVAFGNGASGCAACAKFELVNSAGALVTDHEKVVAGASISDLTLRWIATTTTQDFVRVKGDLLDVELPTSVYSVRFWDTTYSIARWNNSGSQQTVLLISNLTDRFVGGAVDYYSSSGTLLHSHPILLQPQRMNIVNTSGVPALAGQSGHAYVVHDAGYGGLAGKAVALEPGTGFSFDTPLIPIVN